MRYFINKKDKHWVQWNVDSKPYSRDSLLARMEASGYVEVSVLRYWFFAIFKI